MCWLPYGGTWRVGVVQASSTAVCRGDREPPPQHRLPPGRWSNRRIAAHRNGDPLAVKSTCAVCRSVFERQILASLVATTTFGSYGIARGSGARFRAKYLQDNGFFLDFSYSLSSRGSL